MFRSRVRSSPNTTAIDQLARPAVRQRMRSQMPGRFTGNAQAFFGGRHCYDRSAARWLCPRPSAHAVGRPRHQPVALGHHRFHVKPGRTAGLRKPGQRGSLNRFTWNCRVDLARQGGSGAARGQPDDPARRGRYSESTLCAVVNDGKDSARGKDSLRGQPEGWRRQDDHCLQCRRGPGSWGHADATRRPRPAVQCHHRVWGDAGHRPPPGLRNPAPHVDRGDATAGAGGAAR